MKFSLLLIAGVLDYMIGEKNHENRMLWKCQLCDYSTKYKSHCADHMYGMHAKEEKVACEGCGVIYTKRTTLRRHRNKCPALQHLK